MDNSSVSDLTQNKSVSHTDKPDAPQTVTVVDRWRENEMIRYIEHPDGSKTVLEHRTDEQRPFVDLRYPVPYVGRALSVSELNQTNETR